MEPQLLRVLRSSALHGETHPPGSGSRTEDERVEAIDGRAFGSAYGPRYAKDWRQQPNRLAFPAHVQLQLIVINPELEKALAFGHKS